jgi:hypothetical protein
LPSAKNTKIAKVAKVVMTEAVTVMTLPGVCKPPRKTLDHIFNTQHGSAMIELCIALLPIIMLGSLILEVTYWHTARQRLALAMSQAVDLATMQHGSASVAWHFLHSERPELNIQVHDVQSSTDTTPIFADFSDPVLSKRFGQPTIRHDFLNSQHEQYELKGWQGGRGPTSGETILGANTLSLTVTAWHKPYLSWLGAVMQRLWGHKRLPIRVTQSALMQSHRFKPATPFMTRTAMDNINNKFNDKYLFSFSKSTNLPIDQKEFSYRTQNRLKQSYQPSLPLSAPVNLSTRHLLNQQSIPPFIPRTSSTSITESQACGAGVCCEPEAEP